MRRVLARMRALRAENRPVRFVISRLLWTTRLCLLFRIRKRGYALRFYPSSVSAAYWTFPDARAADERLVQRCLDPGATFVDVGANIGTLTAVGALAVRPGGAVYAIEPHPRIHGYLRGNVRRNGFQNVTTYQCALGERAGVVTFSNRHADDMNTVAKPGTGVEVPVRRLDDLDTGTAEVALLKIDVEGYERFVLLGGRATLERARTVMIESCEAFFTRFGYSTPDLLALLFDAGFTCLRFVGTAGEFAPVPRDYRSATLENLFAVRDVADFLRRTGRAPAPGS